MKSMQINEAESILGLNGNYSEEEIKHRYRKLVKMGNHPDQCSTYFEKTKAARRFHKLTEARYILISKLNNQNDTVKVNIYNSHNDFFKEKDNIDVNINKAYEYNLINKDKLFDDILEKIFNMKFIGEILGFLLMGGLFFVMFTVVPLMCLFTFLLKKLNMLPEDGPKTIANHYLSLLVEIFSIFIGGIILWYIVENNKYDQEWLVVYVIVSYIVFSLIVLIIEILSFFYYIKLMKKYYSANYIDKYSS